MTDAMIALGGRRMTEPDAKIRWIDLSPYGITLHALRLPSGRVALVAAGDTAAHGAALAALGFRRTRQGHVVHPEPTLPFRDVRVHFPRASVQEMARETVVRVVPVAPASPIARRNRQRRPSDPQRHAVGDQPARSAGL